MLQHLGLSEYKTTFNDEKIDIESFVRIAGSRCCFSENSRSSVNFCFFWSHFSAPVHHRGSERDGNPPGSQEKDRQVCKRESQQAGNGNVSGDASECFWLAADSRLAVIRPGCPPVSAGE